MLIGYRYLTIFKIINQNSYKLKYEYKAMYLKL